MFGTTLSQGEGGFWVTLSKYDVFLWTSLSKYSESQLFLSLIVTKLVNLGKESNTLANGGFSVNITGFIVHREILLVFAFV